LYFIAFIFLSLLLSCNRNKKKDKIIVADPESMDEQVAERLNDLLETASDKKGKIDDSTTVSFVKIVSAFYTGNGYRPVWSTREKWQPLGDSLYRYIANAELEGLFPEDYHFKNLKALKNRLDTDSLSRMDVVMWTRADILLTDGFMRLVNDLKRGRLQPDSISLNKDTVLTEQFFTGTLKELLDKKQFSALLTSLQPMHRGYWELKAAIKSFVDSMDRRTFTYVNYPFKRGDPKDSVFFIRRLHKRLLESNYIE